MKTYKCEFFGRAKGVIGIMYWFTDVLVNAENEEKARLALYATHEHIMHLTMEEVKP